MFGLVRALSVPGVPIAALLTPVLVFPGVPPDHLFPNHLITRMYRLLFVPPHLRCGELSRIDSGGWMQSTKQKQSMRSLRWAGHHQRPLNPRVQRVDHEWG